MAPEPLLLLVAGLVDPREHLGIASGRERVTHVRLDVGGQPDGDVLRDLQVGAPPPDERLGERQRAELGQGHRLAGEQGLDALLGETERPCLGRAALQPCGGLLGEPPDQLLDVLPVSRRGRRAQQVLQQPAHGEPFDRRRRHAAMVSPEIAEEPRPQTACDAADHQW